MRKAAATILLFLIIASSFCCVAQSKTKSNTFDSGYAEVNGTRLYYEIAGKGEPIIFIHGSFGDRRFWDFQFHELLKKYRVLRYDLRGFGKSALPDSNEVYRDSDDLNALMDFLKIKKANICGLSFGSFIVIDFGLAHPEKCLSLIPIGPRVAGDELDEYHIGGRDSLRMTIARVTNILKTKGRNDATDYLWSENNCLSNTVQSQKTRKVLLKMGYEYSWWRHLHSSKREYAFPTAIKNLGAIKIPTLVVTAEYDLELCKAVADILAKGIPNAKLVSIKGAGHIMNMDRPKEFNKMVSEFVDKIK